MPELDPRTPVIVGAGQVNDRDRGSEPIDLMARCVDAALADSGSTLLRERVDAVRVVWGVWPYRDPGRLVAERIGAPRARTTITTLGGNQVYDLVIDTATRIADGAIDVAVVCAAETLRSRRADKAAGRRSVYLPEREGAAPDDVVGSADPLSTPSEDTVGAGVPTTFYAMAETALRHRNRESIDGHRRRVAELWSRASHVAAANPSAWVTSARSADDIATVSDRNRPIASPYPKLMTSNLDVDQGGAVVMCSAAAADAGGVPRDRWVFPLSGVGAHDHGYVTNRWAYDESPAMRLAGTRALELAGVGHADCAFVDLYSCFPVAVQVAQRELAFPVDREFTITGGLTFGGGPLNCYCILPLTRVVGLLRDRPDELAFLTGNGGCFTKHSMLVLGARPGPRGFATDSVQHAVDALPRRDDPVGTPAQATLETYTVTYGRDGTAAGAVVAAIDAAGSRHIRASADAELIDALLADDCCGVPLAFDGAATHLAG